MENKELWTRLAKEGQFVAFRFDATDQPPKGLVFQLADGSKVIVRPADGGNLEIEPHW